MLRRFDKAYKVQFALFRRDGTQVAGEKVALPPAVAAKITERRGMGEGLGRGPPPGRGPRWRRGEGGGPQAGSFVRTESSALLGRRLPAADRTRG